MRLPRLSPVLLTAALLLAGCIAQNSTDGQSATASGGGSFSKAGNLAGSSKTEQATWTNGGATARGTYAVNAGSGTVAFTIKDDAGETVWSQTVSRVGQATSSFTTSSGEPGTWTLTVKATGFSGQYSIEGRSS